MHANKQLVNSETLNYPWYFHIKIIQIIHNSKIIHKIQK